MTPFGVAVVAGAVLAAAATAALAVALIAVAAAGVWSLARRPATAAGRALAGWLLAYDPDRTSARTWRRAAHWTDTLLRFGILYVSAFLVLYAVAWAVLRP